MSQKELNKVLDELGNKGYPMVQRWLYDKANSFAPDDKAMHLHQACNKMIPVIKDLYPDYFNE
jgi:hypothetical protein